MLPEFSLIQIVITLCSFLLTCMTFKLYIKPYYRLLYYKRQGLPTFFNWKLVPVIYWWKDVREKGDFFHRYRHLFKSESETKAWAENFLSQVVVKIIDPDMIKDFLQKYDTYHKDRSFTGLFYDLGQGSVVQMEGVEWKKRRKILSTAFNFEYLKNTIPMIIDVTQSQFDQWVQRSELVDQNLVEKMALITGEVTGRFMFGKSFEDKKLNGLPLTIAMLRLLTDISAELKSLPNILFGANAIRANILPRHKKLTTNIADMRTVCKTMIKEQSKATERKEKNIINLLLDLKSGDGVENLTDEDITGEFIGFFAAGTDTSAHLVGAALYFLWKHPHALEQVQKEVDREFSDLSRVDVNSINRMDYTNAVLKEALRLAGPGNGLFDRIAQKDDEICGLKIKKGTMVNMFMNALYTLEKYFSRPQEFIPERWLTDVAFSNEGFKKENYAYVPFSAGPRNCIGQHLSMMESKIILALFLKKFDFSLPEGFKFVLAMRFVYESLDPLMVTLRPKRT